MTDRRARDHVGTPGCKPAPLVARSLRRGRGLVCGPSPGGYCSTCQQETPPRPQRRGWTHGLRPGNVDDRPQAGHAPSTSSHRRGAATVGRDRPGVTRITGSRSTEVTSQAGGAAHEQHLAREPALVGLWVRVVVLWCSLRTAQGARSQWHACPALLGGCVYTCPCRPASFSEGVGCREFCRTLYMRDLLF